MTDRVVCHIDFDYFFAQCEEMRRPDLKTRPVAVCVYSDRGGDSGAIATANYLARKYGVNSGMPIKFAKKKLSDVPEAVFLPTDFEYYGEISENAMEIIKSHADIFEYVGRDEAYLDVTNRTEHDFKKAAHLAQQLKNSLRTAIKLSSTIGISSNKLVSKIASGYKKPDGLTIVEPQYIESFFGPLPIAPTRNITFRNSSIKHDSTFSVSFEPLTAALNTGWETLAKQAFNVNAFATSVPLRKPPEAKTGIFTVCVTSTRLVAVGMPQSQNALA